MVPLNQTITHKRAGVLDDWGKPTETQSEEHKCRIDEGTHLTRDAKGKEIVAGAQVLIKGLVQIAYSDLLEWEDENGNKYSRSPLNISIVRDFGGKPMLTKVMV